MTLRSSKHKYPRAHSQLYMIFTATDVWNSQEYISVIHIRLKIWSCQVCTVWYYVHCADYLITSNHYAFLGFRLKAHKLMWWMKWSCFKYTIYILYHKPVSLKFAERDWIRFFIASHWIANSLLWSAYNGWKMIHSCNTSDIRPTNTYNFALKDPMQKLIMQCLV